LRHIQPFFPLVIFWIGSHGWPWAVILITYAPCIAGITTACHYVHLLCWDGVSLMFFLGWP
jgi:hypothetical protein